MLPRETQKSGEGRPLAIEPTPRPVQDEHVLFVLPEPMEEAIMAAHVISQYMVTRLVMARDALNTTIVCPCEAIHPYVKACWDLAEVVKEPTEKQIENSKFTFEFDSNRAYLMTQEVQKNIQDSLAIQLGVGLWKYLPSVLVENTPENAGLVLVAERNVLDGVDESWEWPWREEFIRLGHERQIPMSWIDKNVGWDEIRKAVGRASVVVGVRSTVTLIAASANKLTMELSPEDKGHPEWFRKTDKPFYQMMYGRLEQMTAEFVWQHVARMVEKMSPLGKKARSTEAQTEENMVFKEG